LTPSFHMQQPVCIYFHSESSQKNTRMPELDTARHVVRLVRYKAPKTCLFIGASRRIDIIQEIQLHKNQIVTANSYAIGF
ncbi:MAG: hypothetical protein PHY54_17610, partial [Methylococcales bacterium]|nr:hypothetical protein [Methylococcales bacterium]